MTRIEWSATRINTIQRAVTERGHMKTIPNNQVERVLRSGVSISRLFHTTMVCALAFSLVSCSTIDPREVDVELPETAPTAKITSYTEALPKLGLMTEIYSTDILRIQSNPIGDVTGASQSTGSEIPRDITEMIKTTLNSMGGNVLFIPYDPAFIQNQQVTGYSNFENKEIPEVVLSGGITEFDRGLTTRGENTDVSLEAEIKSLPGDFLPSKNVGLRYGDEGKAGVARITLDFNMLDFQTLAGIPKINAVNTMEVLKAVAGKELGISLFGQNFGFKGTVKRVQGRHHAVRLLVELSMMQVVGKYLAIPYWRLLGEDALPDPVVTAALSRAYASQEAADVTQMVKQWLFIYGYDLPLNGELDEKTKDALQTVDPDYDPSSDKISSDTFVKVYINIPITYEAGARQQEMVALLNAQEPAEAVASDETDAAPTGEAEPALADQGQPASGEEETSGAAMSPYVELEPTSSEPEGQPAAEPEGQPTLVQQDSVPEPAPTAAVPVAAPTAAAPPAENVRAQSAVEKKAAPKPTYVAGPKRTGIGKFLTEEEW